MDFQSFIQKLKPELSKPLPGEEAQFKMAPVRRLTFKEYYEQGIKNAKQSAVLICFYSHNNSIYTVLILRPSKQGIHSDQVSFPGGGVEDSDESLEATSLREAEEEIGIDKSQVTLIGRLSPVYIPVSNYHVQPVVGFMNERPTFHLNKEEVSAVIEMDINSLNEIIKDKFVFKSGIGTDIEAPFYGLQNLKIWGATAMMLAELESIIKNMDS